MAKTTGTVRKIENKAGRKRLMNLVKSQTNKLFYKGKEVKCQEPTSVAFDLRMPEDKRRKANRMTITVPDGMRIERVMIYANIKHAKRIRPPKKKG